MSIGFTPWERYRHIVVLIDLPLLGQKSPPWLTPQSLRGQPLVCSGRLPTVLPFPLTRLLVNRNGIGLHRYKPVRARFHLPDKEFRSVLLLADQAISPGGLVISASLPLSPEGSDYLFI